MARHRALHLAIPFKLTMQRLSAVALLIASVMLLVAGRMNPMVTDTIRNNIVDAVMPVVDVVARPIHSVIQMGKSTNEIFYIRHENAALRSENTQLRKQLLAAQQANLENIHLRELLNFVGAQETSYITARVVADSRSPYLHSVSIDAGSTDGVKKGQAVVNAVGLVGRIIEVGEHSARILLVTDLNSRIPIMTSTSRYRGILGGSNTDAPELHYIPTDNSTVLGEVVITSGDGGYFPPGLPIGTIQTIEKDKITVKPFVEWNRLEFVSIVK